MRRSTYLSIIGVTAVLGGVAAPALAADCATAQFSQAVLDRFPNIRLVCSEIIEKDGQQYAVVKGDLVRTGNNAVYMKFKLADGTKSDTRKIETRPEFPREDRRQTHQRAQSGRRPGAHRLREGLRSGDRARAGRCERPARLRIRSRKRLRRWLRTRPKCRPRRARCRRSRASAHCCWPSRAC